MRPCRLRCCHVTSVNGTGTSVSFFLCPLIPWTTFIDFLLLPAGGSRCRLAVVKRYPYLMKYGEIFTAATRYILPAAVFIFLGINVRLLVSCKIGFRLVLAGAVVMCLPAGCDAVMRRVSAGPGLRISFFSFLCSVWILFSTS